MRSRVEGAGSEVVRGGTGSEVVRGGTGSEGVRGGTGSEGMCRNLNFLISLTNIFLESNIIISS